MAKLPEEIIINVLYLQRKFLEAIDEIGKTEFILFERYGETEATFPELSELQKLKERADSYYSRFYIILRRIYESQPVASSANLELLGKTIEEAEAVLAAIKANIQEIKNNWYLS